MGLTTHYEGKAVERYKGCVLGTGEHNYYNDSDFYAKVWDEEAGCIREVEYGTTRCADSNTDCNVDATPEVRVKAAAWMKAQALAEWRKKNEEQARKPQKGKTVMVVKGKWKGTVGKVFWMGERRSQYGTWSYGWRVGLNPVGKTEAVWVDEGNVEVVGWEQYLEPESEGERMTRWADKCYAAN